ncbi:hypothetical protein F5887DRAFT_950253, partial [Amanita rubescens]
QVMYAFILLLALTLIIFSVACSCCSSFEPRRPRSCFGVSRCCSSCSLPRLSMLSSSPFYQTSRPVHPLLAKPECRHSPIGIYQCRSYHSIKC